MGGGASISEHIDLVEEQAKPLDASDITDLEAGKKELIRFRTILKSLVLDTADNPPGGSETSGGEHSELSKMKREQEIKQNTIKI